MAIPLRWSEEALEDIESIANYIERDSPNYAKSVVEKIFDKAELLEEFPELGRVPEFNDPAVREIFIYSYRFIYKYSGQEILVIAVIHGKRILENYR